MDDDGHRPYKPAPHAEARPADFPTTDWALVVASGGGTCTASRDALAHLCERYWYPLYAYVRRRGHDPDQAQDLTQGFFARFLEQRFVERADPGKGRFRFFLLSSLKFFLSDEFDRANARKRGAHLLLPFEVANGEELYKNEPSHDETPERLFNRRWAHATLDSVIARLRDEFAVQGRLDHFNRLRAYLLGRAEVPYVQLASQLGLSEGALKVAIHRIRKRYRELLRSEIEETVADPSDVEGELRFLASALAENK